MLSSADRWGNRLRCWNTMPTFCCGDNRPSTRTPSTQISPESGTSRRARHRSKVVFPDPLGPMSTRTWPRERSNEMPRSTLTWPKCFWRLRTRIVGAAWPAGLLVTIEPRRPVSSPACRDRASGPSPPARTTVGSEAPSEQLERIDGRLPSDVLQIGPLVVAGVDPVLHEDIDPVRPLDLPPRHAAAGREVDQVGLLAPAEDDLAGPRVLLQVAERAHVVRDVRIGAR